MNYRLILEHLYIVICASILSILLGIILGIVAYRYQKLTKSILFLTDILQTIPTLALLGVMLVFFGPGKNTVIFGVMLYSLLPIVRNTYLGFTNINSGIKEAATGMGMSQYNRLLQVELPLAFPSIFTGIRIALINSVGTVVFAAFVGGGGLGSLINHGIRLQKINEVLQGTLILMLIAIILDFFIGIVERYFHFHHGNAKHLLGMLICLIVCFIMIYPWGVNYSKNNHTIVLYDGDYTETKLIYRMVQQLVENRTDLQVDIRDQMTQVNNFKAMVEASKDCDLMISYDGTILTTFLHIDPIDVPKTESIYSYAKQKVNQQYHLSLLGKLGFDNTYAIAIPQEIATKYQVTKISDLVSVAKNLSFGAEHAFFSHEGSMKYGPFVQFYELQFQSHKSVDISLKYAAIANREFDVTEVFATDGMNIQANLTILDDDRSFFPDYNGALLVKEDLFERVKIIAPNLQSILAELENSITTAEMAQMTYLVDVKGKQLEDVAYEALITRQLLHS